MTAPKAQRQGTNEPRWDFDWEYGRQSELLFENVLQWIADGNGRVEIKHKSYPDFKVYVELKHDPGRRGQYLKSGLAVTKADYYVYAIGDEQEVLVIVKTSALKAMVKHPETVPTSCDRGSCPTIGRLICLWQLLNRDRTRDPFYGERAEPEDV